MTTEASKDMVRFEDFPEDVKFYGRKPPQFIQGLLKNGVTLELLERFGSFDLPTLKRGNYKKLKQLYEAMKAGLLVRDGNPVDFYQEYARGEKIEKEKKAALKNRKSVARMLVSSTPPTADSPVEPNTPGNMFQFNQQTMSAEKTFCSFKSNDLDRQSSDSSQGSANKYPSPAYEPSLSPTPSEYTPESPTKSYKNYCETCKDDCEKPRGSCTED